MKYIFLYVLMFSESQLLFAQKRVIDFDAYKKWPSLGGLSLISNNGKYIAYEINSGSTSEKQTDLVIQSTEQKWKLKMVNQRESRVLFTSDSKYCIYFKGSDSLNILNLLTKKIKSVPNVNDFSIAGNYSQSILIYSLKDQERTTVVYNLFTGKDILFKHILLSLISDDGKSLIIENSELEKNKTLIWINPSNERRYIIWESKGELGYPVVDFKHQQLAFQTDSGIWYYRIGMPKAVRIAGAESMLIDTNFTIGSPSKFSVTGDRLFMSLELKNQNKVIKGKQEIEIWSYKDAKLQSLQQKELANGETNLKYLAVVNLKDYKIIQLQKHPNELFFNRQFEDIVLSSYISGNGSYKESWWNISSQRGFDIIDTRTGERKHLQFLSNNQLINPVLSNSGKYILYYDVKLKGYFSYEMLTGKARFLTQYINSKWTRESDDFEMLRGVVGSLTDDEKVLIYDSFDIWKIDLTGKRAPVNLTNGYGAKNKIVFSLATETLEIQDQVKHSIFLSGFNTITKNNGFFKITVDRIQDPQSLSLGAFIYRTSSKNVLGSFDFTPIKSRDAQKYLVRRQSATDAPNFYVTTDFRTFKKMSDLEPHRNYNWLTSELHTWKSINGKDLQGILYKPEDFDPNKKYPLILYYYERLSDGLNAFLLPNYSSGRIDIPTYVSNGYMVFCPDIYYSRGEPMQGTYDAIISAAKYLSSLSFVNQNKMGVQGHSWGGFQTNYIVTRTKIFAAACSSAGISDWPSAYGTLYGNDDEGYENSLAANFENRGQLRMDKMLWGHLSEYISSSPIFMADKVTTPLLLMHTRNDRISPFSNILEFFIGLRRMGKRCWMLVYPKGIHTIQGAESYDFTIRMQQFFDHYLKDKPAPIWMLDGVTAKDSLLGAGLQSDSSGRTPGTGLLISEQQYEVDSLTIHEPNKITLK